MNTKENKIIKELSRKYNKKEKVIQIMYIITKETGDTIDEFKEILKKLYCY